MGIMKNISLLFLSMLFAANVMAAGVGDVVTVTTHSGEVVSGTVAQVAADGTPLVVTGTGAAQGVTMTVATATNGALVVTSSSVVGGAVAATAAAAGAVSATTVALAAAVVGAVAVVSSNDNNTTTTTTHR